MEEVSASIVGENAISHTLSMSDMFLNAHIVVQIIMVGLVLASVWTWAIILDRALVYVRTRVVMKRFESIFWSGKSLEELFKSQQSSPRLGYAPLFIAAMQEWRRTFEATSGTVPGLPIRIDKVLDAALNEETERLERRLLILATIGSAAPFVGLLGTVWGIMTSFQAIAHAKSTNLAVVAPGIAEALLATALGLLAAIPAVVAYNKLTNDAGRITARLARFADEFSAILSRQIDDRV